MTWDVTQAVDDNFFLLSLFLQLTKELRTNSILLFDIPDIQVEKDNGSTRLTHPVYQELCQAD